MNYKTVEGIDEQGKPTTFKIEIPEQPKEEPKLISKDEKLWWWREYHYEYRGYTLVEVYFDDSPECVHHSCEVFKGDKRLIQFDYGNCVDDAVAYIDGRFYWYYDEEQVYHIEDSKTRKIVYIAIARNPQEVIDEFLKIKES